MPLYRVLIDDLPPIGEFMRPRMATHGFDPVAGDFSEWIGECPMPDDMFSAALEDEWRATLLHPVLVRVIRLPRSSVC